MLQTIRKLFSSKQNKTTPPVKHAEADSESSSGYGPEHPYNEQRISRQKMFERWVCKDAWLLRDQGIPLLLGIEPGVDTNDVDTDKIDELWQHARECVNKNMLSVANPDVPEEQWEVTPANLYCWATVSRVEVPIELATLMEFVLQTVKREPVIEASSETGASQEQDASYLRHRELTLGAALSLLKNSPESCQSRSGKVKADRIAAMIMEQADIWFEKEAPLLAQSAMEDLINHYFSIAQNPLQSNE